MGEIEASGRDRPASGGKGTTMGGVNKGVNKEAKFQGLSASPLSLGKRVVGACPPH